MAASFQGLFLGLVRADLDCLRAGLHCQADPLGPLVNALGALQKLLMAHGSFGVVCWPRPYTHGAAHTLCALCCSRAGLQSVGLVCPQSPALCPQLMARLPSCGRCTVSAGCSRAHNLSSSSGTTTATCSVSVNSSCVHFVHSSEFLQGEGRSCPCFPEQVPEEHCTCTGWAALETLGLQGTPAIPGVEWEARPSLCADPWQRSWSHVLGSAGAPWHTGGHRTAFGVDALPSRVTPLTHGSWASVHGLRVVGQKERCSRQGADPTRSSQVLRVTDLGEVNSGFGFPGFFEWLFSFFLYRNS